MQFLLFSPKCKWIHLLEQIVFKFWTLDLKFSFCCLHTYYNHIFGTNNDCSFCVAHHCSIMFFKIQNRKTDLEYADLYQKSLVLVKKNDSENNHANSLFRLWLNFKLHKNSMKLKQANDFNKSISLFKMKGKLPISKQQARRYQSLTSF